MRYLLIIIFLLLLLLPLAVLGTKPKEPKEIQIPNVRLYAFESVTTKWNLTEWYHFIDLIERESKWDNTAQNPNSSAYGIGQFLNSTWEIVDCEKTSNPYIQIDCMIKYVETRYEYPQKAIQYHYRHNWY